MTCVSPPTSVQISCSTGEANAVVSNNRGNGRCPRRPIQTRLSFKASPVILKQSLNAEHAPRQNEPLLQSQWITLAMESLSNKNGPELVSLLDPRNLSWSPSTATSSTTSSPSSGNDVWDVPKTPCRPSSKASPSKTLGLLTPPTTLSLSVEEKFDSRAAMLQTPKIPWSDEWDVSIGRGTWADEDSFQPKKLFRNLTLELEAISKANVAAVPINYSLKPSFSFSLSESKPISSRTRSKVGTSLYSKASDSVERVVSIANAQTAKAPLARSTLPSLLEHILPLKIHSRLSTNPHICVGSAVKDPSERCSCKHRGSMSSANTYFQNIATCRENKDYHTMLGYIESLVRVTMCGRHQNVALLQPKAEARILRLRKLLTNITSMPGRDRSKLDEWLDVVSDPKASTEQILWLSAPPMADKDAGASTGATRRPGLKANLALPKVQNPYSSKFMPFQEKKTVLLSVSTALQEEIKKPLGKGDHKEGFIYIFWDKEHFGRLKIGRTNDLKRRLQDWDRKCKRTHSYHPNSGNSIAIMPHVHRVERLIHAELKEFREKRMCEGCGKTHIEWFHIEEAHAAKVARKWQEWIMQKPYVFDQEVQQWVLKHEMADELDQICEPLPREKATPKQRRKSDRAKCPKKNKGHRVTM